MQRWSAPILAAGTLCIVIAVFALLGGCKSDSSRARETANTFLSAFQRADRPAAEAQLTRVARERGWIGEEIAKTRSHDTGFTLGEPQIEKDTAQVPVTFTSESKPTEGFLRLRREEGAWRVWGLTFRQDGVEFTLDFEHPENMLGDVGRVVGQALGSALRDAARGMESFFTGLSQGATETQRQLDEQRRQLDEQQKQIAAQQREAQEQLEAAKRQVEEAQREAQRKLDEAQRDVQRQLEEAQRQLKERSEPR